MRELFPLSPFEPVCSPLKGTTHLTTHAHWVNGIFASPWSLTLFTTKADQAVIIVISTCQAQATYCRDWINGDFNRTVKPCRFMKGEYHEDLRTLPF